MNKAKLKTYAPQARRDFIKAVGHRANLLGFSEQGIEPAEVAGDTVLIGGKAWPRKIAASREKLAARIRRDGLAQTLEAMAYTWFNRFAALRYMELHEFLGHGYRVLSNRAGNLPEILEHAADLDLPGLQRQQVIDLKLAGDQDNALYRLLLIAQCNALASAMPFLFERIDDETELLLPDNLLHTDSVIAKLVADIPEEDWREVEIIGWLYQFYISEKKDQVIGKVVKSEDIPAATQLFTPNWIVKYLVQNSVGRLWLMANPHSGLKAQMDYYIEPAEQTPEVQAQLDALIQTRMDESGGRLDPETLTVLDPACGSGHILVEAYDLLKQVYLEAGFQPRSIARLILEKNLYGLDIDERAAQMAGFALLMKARADDRRILENPPRLNVLAIQDSRGLDREHILDTLAGIGAPSKPTAPNPFADFDLFPETRKQRFLGEDIDEMESAHSAYGLKRAPLTLLLETFTDAKTFGSLIQIPEALDAALPSLVEGLKQASESGDVFAQAAAAELVPLVWQMGILIMKFDAVVANPPYMGLKGINDTLKWYAKKEFPDSKNDLFSMFIERSKVFGKKTAELGLLTPYTWMFISSYKTLREKIINNATIKSLIQLEYNAFEPACVPVCCFSIGGSHVKDYVGSYIKLSDFKGYENQPIKTLEAIKCPDCNWLYKSKPDGFAKIPGNTISYWISDKLINIFYKNKSIGDFCEPRVGMTTGDNSRFIRFWAEVSLSKIGFNIDSEKNSILSGLKWFPVNKGGEFRKWYGNFEFIVDWFDGGKELINSGRCFPRSREWYFKECITWTAISSSSFGVRYCKPGFIPITGGSSLYFNNSNIAQLVVCFLGSKLADFIMRAISQTLNIEAGNIASLPIIINENLIEKSNISHAILDISKRDWNAFETSWDFQTFPWLPEANSQTSLSVSWQNWHTHTRIQIQRMQKLETENNRLFIEAYDLQDELSPKVPEDQITLARADREKDSQRLISYAIGCMMGRYSLDEPGLIYAHAGNIGFDASRYPSFPADADGILPLTDEHWFEDDAAQRIRDFLLAVWGPETLTENLAWLAESLGKKASETPEETLRRYLSDKFFKDHLQTYKKRPIYWLFSSGKQGAFQALVYLHRYHEGTLARMRNEYVIPLAGKIAGRIEFLEQEVANAPSTAARNKAQKNLDALRKKQAELAAYDEQLRHYSDLRIALDLDDGVKVNYGKFGNLLAEVKAVTGGSADD